jgi:hypothetical protein
VSAGDAAGREDIVMTRSAIAGGRKAVAVMLAGTAAVALAVAGEAAADPRSLSVTARAARPVARAYLDAPVAVPLTASVTPAAVKDCVLGEPRWEWTVESATVERRSGAGPDPDELYSARVHAADAAAPEATVLLMLNQLGRWTVTVKAAAAYTGSGPGCPGAAFHGEDLQTVELEVEEEVCAVADETAPGSDLFANVAAEPLSLAPRAPAPARQCDFIEVAGHTSTNLYACVERTATCAETGEEYDRGKERARTDWVTSCQKSCDPGTGCGTTRSCKSIPAPTTAVVTTREVARCCPEAKPRACWVSIVGACACECR